MPTDPVGRVPGSQDAPLYEPALRHLGVATGMRLLDVGGGCYRMDNLFRHLISKA